MQYTVNTKQRLYIGENKFSIMLYKKMIISFNKTSRVVAIYLGEDAVFQKKLSDSVLKSIKKNAECLTLAASCEPLLEEYLDDIRRIIKNNSKYISTIFKQLL